MSLRSQREGSEEGVEVDLEEGGTWLRMCEGWMRVEIVERVSSTAVYLPRYRVERYVQAPCLER